MRNMDNIVRIIETIKIERHPRLVAIKPPNKVQTPLPPHEPMDQ